MPRRVNATAIEASQVQGVVARVCCTDQDLLRVIRRRSKSAGRVRQPACTDQRMCEREISVADNQRCHAGRGALLASAEATLLFAPLYS